MPVAAAVSMPMTWPWALTSGPPESPGTIRASVCSMPCSVSLPVALPSSLAVMVWLTPVMVPTTGRAPPWPSALPMATTGLPILTESELPSGIVFSPDAFCSLITATSSVAS